MLFFHCLFIQCVFHIMHLDAIHFPIPLCQPSATATHPHKKIKRKNKK